MILRRLAALLAACVFILGVAPRGGAASASPAPGVRVTQVWSRPALAGDTGVVYATLAAPAHASDRLLSVRSAVAPSAELHESVGSIEPARMEGATMQGMSMHDVSGIPVPAGGRTLLSPGGYHVMLVNLNHALVAGQTFAVTFVFERAGPVTVRATVRPF